MALSGGDRKDILLAIGEVLEADYHDELIYFYSAAVALTERHPEQVNNELRNAITHLSRALAAGTREAANGEIEAAQRHFTRAKRDLLKIAVIELHDRIQTACLEASLTHGLLRKEVRVRRDELTRRRRHISLIEGQGDGEPISEFVELYIEADEFYEYILNHFNLRTKRDSRNVLMLLNGVRGWNAILIGLVIAILGFLICSTIWPNAETTGNTIRKMLHIPVAATPEPTAIWKRHG